MKIRRFTRSLSLAIAFFVSAPAVTPLAVRVAHAEPTAADKETARTLMQDGRAKRTKGDHAGALEAFRAAHGIMKVPTTGLEVGREQIELGQLVEARDTLLEVTRTPKSDGEPAQFATARKEAQKLADGLAPRIPAIRVVLKGLDADEPKTVSVDGVPVPAAGVAVPRKVNPGAHHVVVSARGVERSTDVSVAEGAIADASVDFTGVAKPAAPIAEAPVEKPASTTTVTEVGSTGATSPTPLPKPAIGPLVWIGFGVAAVGVVAGTVTGIAHLSNTSRLEAKCTDGSCPSRYDGEYELTKTLGTVSTISFAVAGAGAVVGVIGLFTRKEPSVDTTPRAALRVRPVVGLGSLGVFGEF